MPLNVKKSQTFMGVTCYDQNKNLSINFASSKFLYLLVVTPFYALPTAILGWTSKLLRFINLSLSKYFASRQDKIIFLNNFLDNFRILISSLRAANAHETKTLIVPNQSFLESVNFSNVSHREGEVSVIESTEISNEQLQERIWSK